MRFRQRFHQQEARAEAAGAARSCTTPHTQSSQVTNRENRNYMYETVPARNGSGSARRNVQMHLGTQQLFRGAHPHYCAKMTCQDDSKVGSIDYNTYIKSVGVPCGPAGGAFSLAPFPWPLWGGGEEFVTGTGDCVCVYSEYK